MAFKDMFQQEEVAIKNAEILISDPCLSEDRLRSKYEELLCSFKGVINELKVISGETGPEEIIYPKEIVEIEEVLKHIPVGAALVKPDGTVFSSVSGYMYKLYGNEKPIGGMNIEDVLYGEKGHKSERSTFRKWIKYVFDFSREWDLLKDLGPSVIEHDCKGGSKYYKHNYHRVTNGESVLFLVVYTRDVTEKILLQKAGEEKKTTRNFDIEVFTALVDQDDATEITEYIFESENMIDDCTKLITSLQGESDKKPVYNKVFRILHSLKGVSKSHGFNELARLSHSIEDILVKLRSGGISFESDLVKGIPVGTDILNKLRSMKDMIINADKTLRKLFNEGKETAAIIRGRYRGLKLDPEKLSHTKNLCHSLEKEIMDKAPDFSDKFSELRENINDLSLQPLDVVYKRFRNIVSDVSESFGKKAEITMAGDRIYLHPETHHSIISSLIHLLRNSLDHGIEKPEVRTATGKPQTGKIHLTTSCSEQSVYITLKDDGAGIDPDTIADRAVSLGFMEPDDVMEMTKTEKLYLILLPGFSSKEKANEISGRGVGMDVVAHTFRQLGGSLKVKSEINSGTTIMMSFPVKKDRH